MANSATTVPVAVPARTATGPPDTHQRQQAENAGGSEATASTAADDFLGAVKYVAESASLSRFSL